MRTRVKFCGLVRPADVDAAVAVGADAVGFVFYGPSPRAIDADLAGQLRRRLPSWVAAVGLFVNEPSASVDRIAGAVGLDVIQFHGDESAAVAAAQAATARLPWWKALRVGSDGTVRGDPEGAGSLSTLLARFHAAECCLLDSASPGYGGSGHRFDWSRIPPGAAARLVLSGGLEAGNVGEAIARIRPFAVDSSSGIQGTTPREKDVGRMERFMAAVQAADGRLSGSPAPPGPVADETPNR